MVRAFSLFYASVLLIDERNPMEWLEEVSALECPTTDVRKL